MAGGVEQIDGDGVALDRVDVDAVAQLRSSQPAEALQTLDRLALLGDTLPVLGLLRAQGLLAAGRKEEAQIEMAQFLARRRENET